MDSDFLLIRKMKQGEETAFDLFVHKYYRDVLAYCAYRLPDKECAEDMTQEAFVRFFTKLSDYHYRGKTKNYLYTIAGNLCKDYFRKIKDVPVEEANLSEETDSGCHQMEAVVNRLTVEWALKRLPDELREVAVLYYFQELKLTEIAGILHIGLSLTKYRLRQAKAQLMELLGKEGHYESGGTTYGL